MKKLKIIAAIAGISLAIAAGAVLRDKGTDSDLILANIEALAESESIIITCPDTGSCTMKCVNCSTTFHKDGTSGLPSYQSGKCFNCGGESFLGV